MRSTLPLLAVVIASLMVSGAIAQQTRDRMIPQPGGAFANTPPEAPHRHSSTYQEGVLRGWAVLTRAYADGVLQESQAFINYETAYSMFLDNRIKLARTELELDQIRRQRYQDARVSRVMNKIENTSLRRLELLQEALEYQLDDFDIDWSTAMIYWPAAASSPRYGTHRQRIEQLMAQIAHRETYVPLKLQADLAKACSKFRSELHRDLQAEAAGMEEIASLQAEFDEVEHLLKGLRYSPLLLAEANREHYAAY